MKKEKEETEIIKTDNNEWSNGDLIIPLMHIHC